MLLRLSCVQGTTNVAYGGLSVVQWAWIGWGTTSEPPLITSPISKLFSTFFSGSGGFSPLWGPIVHPCRYTQGKHLWSARLSEVLQTHTQAVRKPWSKQPHTTWPLPEVFPISATGTSTEPPQATAYLPHLATYIHWQAHMTTMSWLRLSTSP